MIICRYVLGFVIIICTKYDLHELTTRQNAHLLNNKKSFNRLWNELPHLARIHFNPKLSMVLKREKETKKKRCEHISQFLDCVRCCGGTMTTMANILLCIYKICMQRSIEMWREQFEYGIAVLLNWRWECESKWECVACTQCHINWI